MFQSLFYWILFSYVEYMGKSKEKKKVSILILLDSILLYEIETGFLTQKNVFQSLFYWILFSYKG